MDFSLEFMTDYASLYQISKTNDSVRCFPSCLESGHNEGGFCGSTVLAVIRMRINKFFDETVGHQDIQLEQAIVIGEIQPLGSIDTDSVQDHCTENEVRMHAMGKNPKYSIGKITSSTSTDSILFEYGVEFKIRPWAFKSPVRSPANGKVGDYAFVVSILWPDTQSLAHLRVLARMVSKSFVVWKQRIGSACSKPPRPPSSLLSVKRPRDEPELLCEYHPRSGSFSSRSCSSDDDSYYGDSALSSPASRTLSRRSSFSEGLTTGSSDGSLVNGLADDFGDLGFDLDEEDEDLKLCGIDDLKLCGIDDLNLCVIDEDEDELWAGLLNN